MGVVEVVIAVVAVVGAGVVGVAVETVVSDGFSAEAAPPVAVVSFCEDPQAILMDALPGVRDMAKAPSDAARQAIVKLPSAAVVVNGSLASQTPLSFRSKQTLAAW